MKFAVFILVVGCTRSTESNPSAGSSAPPPQISTDAPDPGVAVDAAPAPAPADAAPAPADAARVAAPADATTTAGKQVRDAAPAEHVDAGKPADPKQAACSVDADCVLTMVPAEPACCRSLCNPRAVAKSALEALEAKQAGRICAAVLCAPPAPCPRPRSLRASCQRGACVTTP